MRIAGAVLAVTFVLTGLSWAQEPAAAGSAPPTAEPASPSATPPAPGTPPAPALGERPSEPGAPASGDPAVADLAAARAAAPDSGHVRPDAGLPAATEITIDRRNAVAMGMRFGGPTGASLRLSLLHGLGADVREKNERVDAVCAVPIPHCAGGFLLDAEAGSGGGKLSLGIGANARVQSEDFRGTVGAGLKLSLAQTWGSPIGTDPGLTYLGPELDLYVLRIGVNLGVLWRVAGDGGSSALFSWGLGFRL